MWRFWQVALIDVAVIFLSYLIFRFTLKGEWRHRIWEKYVDSFSMFVIILFLVTAVVNIATYYILFSMRMQEYVNYIAPAVVSIIVGFVLASIPRRGEVEELTKRAGK